MGLVLPLESNACLDSFLKPPQGSLASVNTEDGKRGKDKQRDRDVLFC